jgi:hypothetical protein
VTAVARRPLLVPALLGVLAWVTGGIAGIILGFGAVLLAIDRLLDRFPGWGAPAAERSFDRLAREHRYAARAHRAAPLRYLAEDTGWAAVADRRRLGVQTIPVESIVGSVDPHKAETFDSEFRPPAFSRGRWTQMRIAAERGMPMPPIAVYRVGDEHYVRDGHHRVSVARSMGAARIDADVVDLLDPR